MSVIISHDVHWQTEFKTRHVASINDLWVFKGCMKEKVFHAMRCSMDKTKLLQLPTVFGNHGYYVLSFLDIVR